MFTQTGWQVPDTVSAGRRERGLLVALLLSLFASGYALAAIRADPGAARTLLTPLDAAIPFLPDSIYVYASVYLVMLLPAFVVRDTVLFRRTALAYALVIVVAVATFLIFPVTSVRLRPEIHEIEPLTFTTWGLLTLYALDTPYNLFPSLHVAIMAAAAFAAWEARRIYGALTIPLVLLVAVSTCTVKQHFVSDAVAGLILGASVSALVLRTRPRNGGVGRAYGWAGPVAHLGLHVAVYGALFGAFRAGVRPWDWFGR